MGTLRSILLATDFRLSSQGAAEATVRLATTFSARVTALHVRERFLSWPVDPFENQDRLTAQLVAQKVDLKEFLLHAGPPADTIVGRAQELEVDLLAIGAGEKVRAGQLVVGPVAESILERAESPVLAVNPHGPQLAFRSILCPVDHSRVARRALEDGIQLARALGGRLVVLSVIPDVSGLTAAVETGHLSGARLEYEAQWRKEFDEFLAAVPFDGVQWEREVRHGSPHEQITAAAQERGADLLVMGATGRTGLVRVLLGSVTRRVLRQLPCSLLLVKDRTVFEEQFLLDLDAIDRLAAEGRDKLLGGEPAEAAGKFRQAVALDPYHTAALEGLASACEQLGQADAARRYRNRAERLRRRAGG
jgi:nucleotide-binding universal stress UspA family protein